MLRKFFIFILVVLILSVGVLFLVAKSGLAEVPFLTAQIYDSPSPDHIVLPADSEIGDEIQSQLIDALREKLTADGLTDASVSLTFSEEILTAALRQAIEQWAASTFTMDSSQVAVTEIGSVEIFLSLADNQEGSAIILTTVPTAADGQIIFDIERLRVGELAVPSFLNFLIEAPLRQLTKKLNEYLSEYATLSSISIVERSVVLSGVMTLDLKTLLGE